MAPANQPRLSFTGSEDGEAGTETLWSGEALVAKDESNLRPARAQPCGTARCGPACRVVWQGRVGDHSPYANLTNAVFGEGIRMTIRAALIQVFDSI